MRKEIIEEERVKLLREHAHRLLGYLPKVRRHWHDETESVLCCSLGCDPRRKRSGLSWQRFQKRVQAATC
jgi:hypothetical protein